MGIFRYFNIQIDLFLEKKINFKIKFDLEKFLNNFINLEKI